MNKRGIRILLKCGFCKRMVFHTSYHEGAKKFVCKRCFRLIDHNPHLLERGKKK